MSKRQNMFRDADKRAAKRQRQRDAIARGALPTTAAAPRPSQSQMTHASSGKARKKRHDAGEPQL